MQWLQSSEYHFIMQCWLTIIDSKNGSESNSYDETDEILFSMWIRANKIDEKSDKIFSTGGVLQSVGKNSDGTKRTDTH